MRTDVQPDIDQNLMSLDDLDDLSPKEGEELKAYQKLQHDLMKIDQRISLAMIQKKAPLSADEDVIEVSEPVLRHFGNGEIPEALYVIYKNVKLVLKGKLEEVLKRDNRTTFEVNHPDLAKTTKMIETKST